MWRYIVKRILQAIPLMIAITALCFVLIDLAPYDAVDSLITDKMTKEQIEQKKSADFKLTFETPEHLYIVRGYGEQMTGGYSIQVEELYLSSNAVFFKTTLLGPRKGEVIGKNPSYPYIVIQTESVDKNVVFE